MTYTGGTTGRPKGVLCSHRARDVTAHTVMVEEAIDERDVVAIVTPLFHVAALNIMFQPAILVGATTVFVTRWSAEAFMEAAATHGITAAFMVPTQASTLVRDAGFDADKLRDLAQALLRRRADAGLGAARAEGEAAAPAADADLRPVRDGRDRRAARLVSAGKARRRRPAAVQCRCRGGRSAGHGR